MPIIPRSRIASSTLLAAAILALSPAFAYATITINQKSSTNWTISNGALTLVYNPSAGNITSITVGNSSTNILNPANSQLYQEHAGTPFGSGTQIKSYTLAPDGSYIDFSTTTQSTGDAANPITYGYHYILYNNDPGIAAYETLSHSASDPVTSVGQGQFLLRVNPALMTNTYQINTSINNPVQTSTFRDPSAFAAAGNVDARQVQDATVDLTGSGLAGDFGTNFATKYDFSSYEQFHQAQTEYGPTYALSTIIPNHDTMTGGPTKQNLQFTDTILMQEFLSGHYGASGYAYTPPQGVDSSRLFGPFVFRITTTNGESGAQLYQDAVDTIPTYNALFDKDTALLASGYVPSTQRGSMQIHIANPAGWSSNINTQTIVLSDPKTNFQRSNQGYQYWGQINPDGSAAISGVVPGTYRMSIYQLGQWGETRIDNVSVQSGKITVPQNVAFTPENFGKAAPIWTIGTPDRSAHEFLNGHNADGGDVRQFQGSYDYWKEEQDLGNPGKVVYYATAVGAHPATNDPNKWIANQWKSFDPGLYDAANNSKDNYANIAPAYVGDPSTYTGSPWEVHFSTTQAQLNQGQYVILSVALAAEEASLVVSLNGHSATWSYSKSSVSDPMVRSGDAGFYQWIAFQFPTADLTKAGLDNLFTFSVSQTDGVMYDALRMEITNTSADPSITGWHDYEYVNGRTQIAANDALAGAAPQLLTVPEPATAALFAPLAFLLLKRPGCRGNDE